MSISYVNFTWNYGYPQTTLAVTPAAVGNLQILTVHIDQQFATVASVTGGGVGEWMFVGAVYGHGTDTRLELWTGVVNEAGASTLTVAYAGAIGSSFTDFTVGEYASSYGTAASWAVDTWAGFDVTTSTSGTASSPSLNAAGSNELYYGLIVTPNGSTWGYTIVTPDYNYYQVGDDFNAGNTDVSGTNNFFQADFTPAAPYTSIAGLFVDSTTSVLYDFALSADVASAHVVYGRVTNETSTTSVTATQGIVLHRHTSDTAATSDAITSAGAGFTTSDPAHTSDSATRLFDFARSTSDVSLTADVATGTLHFTTADVSHTADSASGAVVKFNVGHDTSLTGDIATSSVYIPPPAPVWPTPAPMPTLHGLSSEFLAAVVTNQRWIIKVEVWNGNTFLQDITNFVSAGSVSVDETAEIRRTCTLTISGVYSMVPNLLSDLLHPASANELRIYRGVQYDDGTTELAQLGVFRMTKPVITDDDVTPTITVNGQDRASVVARVSWLVPYAIVAGNNIAAAIQAAMETRYPGLQYNFQNVTFQYPATTFGADQVAGSGETSDPMSDLITFAATAGCELFFDVFGVATLRQIINPLSSDVIDAIHFVEGENCTMDTISRTLDESTAFNGVQVFCNGTGTALPFVVTVWDTNPNSPTYYQGPWGQVPYIITTTTIPSGTQTVDQAYQAGEVYAYGQLQLVLGSFDDVSLTCVPNSALREGDCVQVTRNRVKIDDAYVISTMTIPLDALTDMDITFRPRISYSA
jgi:hypothetical protein